MTRAVTGRKRLNHELFGAGLIVITLELVGDALEAATALDTV